MVHPLDGIEAKLARAETHFDAIKESVQRVTGREPDLIPGEFDRQEHRYIFRAQRDSAQGDWLGAVIGDFVHNLRASLDYIVWALSSPAYRNEHPTWIEFPIFADPGKFVTAGGPKKIGGIDPNAQAVIKCLQPFNGPDCRPRYDLAHPTNKPLWHLFELDNWDKHRALNLTEDVASMRLVGFEQLGILSPPQPFRLGGTFKRGAPLAYAAIPLGRPEVDVYLETSYDVAFDKDGPEPVRAEPVIETLDNIRNEIRRRVLPSLLKFLPPR